MSVETWDAQQDVISVTPAAAVHLKNQLESTGNEGVRISIKTSGCTGFMYVLEEVNNSPDGDISLDLDNGVAVFVDPEAIPMLRGTEIDYAREGINRTLVFNNPNVTAACGCGESFSVE
jgi:iron-sulfur cluster assembly accessory protein